MLIGANKLTQMSQKGETRRPIKILLADDHKIVRDGIKALLSDVKGIEFLFEASTGREVIEILEKESVDIVIMDIEMPELDGIQTTKYLTENFVNVNVLALTMHEDESHIIKMLQVGAMGYILKSTGKKELSEAIKTVASGESYIAKEASEIIMRRFMKKKALSKKRSFQVILTKREKEVLKLIAEELTNIEIGEKLFISTRTVDTHRRNLLQKIGVKNTAGLVKYAIQIDIIDP